MIYEMLGTGFEEIEAITPVDLLRRAGFEVRTVGISGKIVTGGHGIGIEADLTLDQVCPEDLDMVILPGGTGGVASLRACPEALRIIRRAFEEQKFVAAICAGPTVLADLGITDGKHATCYPGCETDMGSAAMEKNVPVVRDRTVITGTSAGCAAAFGLELIAALGGRDLADRIREQIVIR